MIAGSAAPVSALPVYSLHLVNTVAVAALSGTLLSYN